MKILLIANYKSVFGKELFENLIKQGINVTILDFETLNIYTNNNQNYKYAKQFAKFAKLPKIHMIFRLFFISKILRETSFDVVNIHTARIIYVALLPILASQKLITTIYGSDFYRQGKLTKKIQKLIYQKSSCITFTNPLTQQSFLDYYNDFRDKSVVCRFGLGTLDFIDKNRNIPKSEIKKELGYSQDKTIVTCGYNASTAQQHEKIIKEILKLPQEILDNIQFIFPMTYGDMTHKEKIKNILKSTILDYIVLENYLYGDKNANIKLASDIMINILTSDSFSGSMQEFLYAKNIVITGSWLPYELFDNEGIIYEKIDSLSALHSKISEVLNRDFTLDKNIKIINNLSSWNNNIKSWIEVYKGTIK